jgi:hypothetical protein
MTAHVSVNVAAGIKRRAIYVLDAEMDLAYARDKRRAIEAAYDGIQCDPHLQKHVDKLVEDQQRCTWRLQLAKYELEQQEMMQKHCEDELRLTPFHDGINQYGHFTGSDDLYVTAIIRHLRDYDHYEWPTEGEKFTVYVGGHAGDSLEFLYSFGTVLVANNLSKGMTCAVQRELCVPPFCLPPGKLFNTEYDPMDAACSPKRPADAGFSPKSPAYEDC